MARLFGTDGIRGVANRDLTPEMAFRIGRVHGFHVRARSERPLLVVGRDTRLSGEMLEAAYLAGACSSGADVVAIGIVPTPGVAWAIRHLGAAGGAVVSASHNPIEDNGIKLFDGEGFKLADDVEEGLEGLLEGVDGLPRPVGEDVGRRARLPGDPRERYVEFLASCCPTPLEGLAVVLDCAYGAACHVAPEVLRRLGARVTALHAEDDGSRINQGCGSTDVRVLCQAVLDQGADLGLAFDGDADRCIAVDERGRVVDGDPIMLIFARWLRDRGELRNGLVVGTVMANLGLEMALRREGLTFVRARVGDRYVLEQLRARDGVLGGEQSGHILLLQHNTTGDGVLTGGLLACIVRGSGGPLSALAADLERVPQRLVNVPARNKERLTQDGAIADAIRRVEEQLADRGRVLVRPSGTEPLVRVMAECTDPAELDEVVEGLSRLIAQRLD